MATAPSAGSARYPRTTTPKGTREPRTRPVMVEPATTAPPVPRPVRAMGSTPAPLAGDVRTGSGNPDAPLSADGDAGTPGDPHPTRRRRSVAQRGRPTTRSRLGVAQRGRPTSRARLPLPCEPGLVRSKPAPPLRPCPAGGVRSGGARSGGQPPQRRAGHTEHLSAEVSEAKLEIKRALLRREGASFWPKADGDRGQVETKWASLLATSAPIRARLEEGLEVELLAVKTDLLAQIDACQQVGGLPTKAESGAQPRPVPARVPPMARSMGGLPAQRPGDAKEAPPI
jgi:hypothetical protein